MAPAVGKVAFTIGLTVLFMSVYALFIVEPGTPEFIAVILSLVFVSSFLALLIWHVRRAARLPMHRSSQMDELTPVRREDREVD